jgi:hypothetical protein
MNQNLGRVLPYLVKELLLGQGSYKWLVKMAAVIPLPVSKPFQYDFDAPPSKGRVFLYPIVSN